jgi:hypothetical protein
VGKTNSANRRKGWLKMEIQDFWDPEQDYELEEKERDCTKIRLLGHYLKKCPSEFIQYDAFVDSGWHDSVVTPNPETGVAVLSGLTEELMSTCNEVRVLIPKDATKEQALQGIKEVFDVIKEEKCNEQESLYKAFLYDKKSP